MGIRIVLDTVEGEQDRRQGIIRCSDGLLIRKELIERSIPVLYLSPIVHPRQDPFEHVDVVPVLAAGIVQPEPCKCINTILEAGTWHIAYSPIPVLAIKTPICRRRSIPIDKADDVSYLVFVYLLVYHDRTIIGCTNQVKRVTGRSANVSELCNAP